MAAICRRPRLGLWAVATLSAALAACSLINQTQEPAADRQNEPTRLVQAGKHADAARAYARLAAEPGADRDYFALQAADQWIAAGSLADAHAALDSAAPDVRAHLPVLRALVAGELAVAENDGPRAIRELDQIQPPAQAEAAATYWWIRGRGAFLAGHPLEGVRSFVERERYLADPAALRTSRQDLYVWVRAAAEHGNPLQIPARTDAVVAGWLDFGPVAAALVHEPARASAALATWRQHYPGHPAEDSIQNAAGAAPATPAPVAYPNQVALLLPLSGRNEAVGVAVRDGFLAAYFAQDQASRPHLRIYDVAAQTAAAAYDEAINDGASLVVGPLTKENVAEVASLAAGRTPLLALNFLGESAPVNSNVYQFALLPEDEARIVARRVAADGHLRGIAILADGEVGTRIGAAFTEELALLGGTVIETERYEPARADFSEIIRRGLQVHGVRGVPSTHRADVSFVFIAGSASAARLIMPQLKFHFAGDIPAYTTSDSYEPAQNANSDIDGLMFPDMPWMVSSDPTVVQMRDSVRMAWPARSARRDRLYAFGFDAFRLAPLVSGRTAGQATEVNGMTGKLRIDANNRIRRELDWAQIRNGIPAPL